MPTTYPAQSPTTVTYDVPLTYTQGTGSATTVIKTTIKKTSTLFLTSTVYLSKPTESATVPGAYSTGSASVPAYSESSSESSPVKPSAPASYSSPKSPQSPSESSPVQYSTTQSTATSTNYITVRISTSRRHQVDMSSKFEPSLDTNNSLGHGQVVVWTELGYLSRSDDF